MLRIQCDACSKLLYLNAAIWPVNELPYAYLDPYSRRWRLFGRSENLGVDEDGTQHVCSEQCLKTMLEIVGWGRPPKDAAGKPGKPLATLRSRATKRRR